VQEKEVHFLSLEHFFSPDNDAYLEQPVAKIPFFHKSASYICSEAHGQAISMVMVKCAMSGHVGDCSMPLRQKRVSQITLKSARFLFPHVLWAENFVPLTTLRHRKDED